MHHLTLKTFRITLLLGVLLSCFAVKAQVAVPFAPRKQVSVKGDITMIGNNIVNRKTESYNAGSKKHPVIIPGKNPNDPYPLDNDEYGSTANDDFNMRYIDVDGDGTTFSSSKATLAIPDMSCSKVIYAALYWSATYRYNFSDDTGGRDPINAIKLKLPGAAAYTPVNGTILYDGFSGIFAANGAYACYADITSLLTTAGTVNGEYTVADIRATQGDFGGGVSGGWNLFVIYENPTYPGKYITSYDGFAGVNSTLGSVDVPYSGFVTVPSPLPVRAKLATAALEGDKQIEGDQLLFRGGANTNPFNQLSNTRNPATNFFNSNITYLDAAGNPQNFTARVPNSGNTLGFDSDIISIPTGYLPNGATQATLQIKSTQDTYYMFFNALSVDIIEPDMRIVKTVEDIEGHSIGGADVTLGQVLDYVIQFDNIGNDDAKNFTIRDILPKNTFYRSVDVLGAPGVVPSYNATTKEILFTIPDNLVKVSDSPYKIRIRVQVVNTCSELTDACSNIIQNLAYSTYKGVLNSNQISNDPSVAGVDTCGQAIQGPANFLVDIDECAFVQEETLCGASITLKAGNGYVAYQWYRINADSSLTPMATTQSITVSAVGKYKVVNTAAAPCIGITQYFNVSLYGANAVSPVKLFADVEVECANDGGKLGKIFLCGVNDHRLIQTNINNAQSIIWEKLNEGSCPAVGIENCANKNTACTWTQIATGQNFDVTEGGQYRLTVNYQTGGCFNVFYFNVTKNLLDPSVKVKNLICNSNGEIRVLGVPSTYEIKLIKVAGGTETVLVDYPNTNQVFPITATGTYKVEIKQTGVANGCIFTLDNIGILKKDLTANVIITNKSCNIPGSITLQALDVEAQYYYNIQNAAGTLNLTAGPLPGNSHEFPNLGAGTYTVTITTDDGCTYTGSATINDYSTLALNATVKQSISCDPGQIQLTASGGLTPYIYAVYSKNGLPQNPGIGDYTLGNPVEILAADAGTYEFITKDANGCTVVSNPVTINNIPGITYTTAYQNVSCNSANNGTFTFNVTATNGYAVAYEIVDVATNLIEAQNATGAFSDLAPGSYIANLIQTGVTNTCRFSTPFTITQPAPLTGTASITSPYTCTTGGATVTVSVPSVTGGTSPYQYSIDGTTFGSATTFTGLTAGTYKVTIKDAKGCSIQTTAMTIAPLNTPTNITFTASAITCPAQTSNVTLAVTGGNAPFIYEIIAPTTVNNGTNAVFNGLAPNTYTFRVTDAKGCTVDRPYTINPITPIAVTGINNNNVVCFGTATGSLTYTVTGFGAGYNYTVTSTGTAIPAATGVTTGTINLTNLAAGKYTITVTNPVTNCTALAFVDITAPTAALTLIKTITQPTCNALGKVVVNATGGWGSNQYELTGTATQTNNNGTFNGLMPGSYTIKVIDGNGCEITNTFILTGAVPPVLAIDPLSDLCYDTTNQASLTALVASGTGTTPFTYKLNNGPAQTSATFAGLNPGTYTISVIDGNSCTASVTKTIYPQLAASATLTKNLDCSASRDAIITVNITGGETDYEYQVSFNGGAYDAAVAVIGNSFAYTVAENDFGTYQFQITDTAGCTVQTVTTTINELHPPKIVSLVPTDVTCNGGSNGSITVNLNPNPIYGLPPFTYAVYRANSGTPYGSQLTGLPAGHYFVTIYDSKGCQAFDTVDIAEPDAIVFTTHETNIQCIDDPVNPGTNIAAGEILVENVVGGTGEYTYSISNNFGYAASFGPTTDTSHPFEILNYGVYQAVVTDENGCTFVKPNIIMTSPPNSLQISVDTTTPPTCASGGTAVVTAGALITGTSYEFAILQTNVPPYSANYIGPDDPANAPRVATFHNLVPGVTYTFVVYDMSNHCYYFETATISIPSSLTASIVTVNDVTCKNANNGNVIFSYSGAASGATVNYQVYNAQSNTAVSGVQGSTAATSGTNTLGPLAPGIYYIKFEEVGGADNGCKTASAQFTITESVSDLAASATVPKNDNGCTPNAGQIVVTAQDGTGPYSYQVVANNATAPTTWVLTNSFNRESGDYDAYVKDAKNCIRKVDVNVPLDSSPDMLPLTVQPPCAVSEGQSNIQITTIPGGIGPMTFSINGGSFQQIPGRIIYGLSSGTYTVVMKDANGCTDTESVTIYAPLNIAPLASTQPTCVNNNGVIRVAGSGGSAAANYRYELQTVAGVSLVASNTTGSFPNLAAGDYKVILTDTATPSCSKELLVNLEAPIPVTFTTTQTNVSCNAGTDGTITATLASGNTDAIYTYSITNGTLTINNQGDGLFANLTAGDWTVTIKSGKNCSETATVTITEPDAIMVSATATDFSCATNNTVNTAVITITATGGTGAKLYSINNGASFFASNTFEVADNGSDQTFDIVVKDANNCQETGTVTVNRLPAITAVAVNKVTGITCNNDETVILTITGGSGDFTFDVLPLGTQASVTPGAGVYTANFDLPTIGDYTFKVTDNVTGCTFTTATYTIVPFDVIDVVATDAAAVTCFGATNGTITIEVTGYTGSFQYEVRNAANSIVVASRNDSTDGLTPFIVTNVPAGSYYVKVRANATPFCAEDTAYITVPGPATTLALTATPNTSVTCTNNKGEITALATGGWGTYQYQLVNTTTATTVQAFDTNNIFTDLPAGSYTVSVKDAGECIVTQTVTFTQPAVIAADISASASTVLCFGASTASVQAINVTGGQRVYQYVLNTYNAAGTTIVANSGTQTSPVFNGLGAGNYSISVTDGWGCGVVPTGIVTITQPTQLTGVLNVTTSATCLTNAELRLSATGGTPPYQYSVDNITYNNIDTFSVPAGTYKYYVKDDNNCTAVLSNSIVVLPVAPVTVNLDLDGAKINCADDISAVIIADATGGLGNYQYELLDGASAHIAGPQSGGTFSGLGAGDYIISVTSGDCNAVVTVPTIINPAEMVVTPVVTPLLCYGDPSGKIVINTTGGTGIIQYAISPNLSQFDTVNEFLNLSAGAYDVIVQDQNGCFEFLHLTVTQPNPIIANIVILTDETCLGEGDGTVEVNITGGTGSYAYRVDYTSGSGLGAWFNFTTPPYIITGIAPGEIVINIKDQNDCFLDPPIDQKILPGVDLQPTADVVAHCVNNVPDNTVTVGINPAINTGNVTYSINGGAYQLSNVFTDVSLPAGTYTASAKHVTGAGLTCIKTASFTIDIHDPIAATAAVTANVLCKGDATGEIEVTATGGTPPLQYAISPGYVYGTTNVFTGLVAGTYDVKVKDAITCEVTTASVTVTEPATVVSATIAHTDEICINANDGTITITPSGGVGPYETSLNGAAFITATTYLAVADGTYTIDVKDANGCSIAQQSVTINAGVLINAEAEVVPNCDNNVIGNVVFMSVDSSVTTDVTYSLDGGTYQASEVFADVPVGSHNVSVLHTNGCEQIVNFTIDPLTAITVTYTQTDVLCNGAATGEIIVTATGGTGTLSYAISDATPPVFVYDASNVFTGLTAGTYTVSVMDDNLGCETQLTVTITEPAAALTATLAHTDETCFDSNNGSITITISGGTAPYETSLNGGAFSTSTSYTALADGTYTIDVRDDNGCSIAQLTQVIQNGVDMQPSAAVTPNCVANTPNNDVVITIATGITATDVTYSIDGTNYQSSNTFTNVGLTPGTYTAYAKHANGCIQTTPFTIDIHNPIAATAAVTTEVLCKGDATGEIEVTATGGTTPLQYAISPGYVYGTTNVFIGLVAGTYDVKVKDAITCEVTTTSVTITEPAATLTATLAHTDETCFDSNNGSITITISGGTAPYETSLNGAAFSTATSYTALADGTYTIDVRDDNGCSIAQLTETILNGVDMQPSAAVTPNCVANTPNNDVVITIASGITASDVTYSIDGINYQSSNTFTNVGLTPGTYTAYAKHANGCIQTTPFTIDVHNPIAATAAVTTEVLCKGDATGEIEVTATGGTTPLEYAISPGYVYGTTNVFTGLVAGTYDVKVKDAITCEVTTASVTVTEPAAALTATLAHTDETCFDSNNGSITITISGGTAPYETSLNGAAFSTSTSYTALADGTYTIDVRDDNGCSIAQLTQVIQNGVDMQPSAAVTPNCVANTPNNDVVITIASGITASDVTYSIDGTNYQSSNTFTNVGLTPGTYTAYAQHANGCIQTTPFTIDVHDPIAATAAVTANVLCKGDATGEIEVTATGGTTPLQYAISPGYVYSTTNVFTGLVAGTYDVKVKDAITCEVTTASVTVTEPATVVSATIAHTDEICINANDGTITITPSGGVGPYETSLNGAAFITATTYLAVADGTYTIDVKDANGCSIAQQSVTINAGVLINAEAEVVPNCDNNVIGNVVFMSVDSSVTTDVTYSLDGGTYQASEVFADVPVGSHNVSVLHTNGCEQIVNFIIDPLTAITATYTQTDVLCKGAATGEIVVTATGGTGTLSYAVSDATPPVFATYDASNIFTGLTAGTYVVSVMDDNLGCETQLTVTITEPAAALTATLAHTDETCFDSNNGSITITIAGGTAPYETSLNGAAFSTATSYTALADGTYTIDVRDDNGCSIAQLTETIQNGVDMQPSAGVTPNCVANAPNNDVVITIATGVTGTVTYSIDGTTYQSSNTFTNVGLVPNTYTAYVQHANGCIQTTPFTIDVHDPIAATAAVTANVLCKGDVTGEIEVTATGGTTSLQYAISPGYVYGTTNLFTGLAAGTYDVKVKDAITCEFTTASVTVTEPAAALTATLAHTDETCFDSNNGSITITIAGGTAPYETSLNGAAYTTATSYTALADGTYTIDVRDDNGCSIAQLTETIQNGVDMQPSAAVTPNCVANAPNNDVEITIAAGITATDVTYSLDGTTYQLSNTFTNVGLVPNTYTAYVQHANGCIQTTPFTIDIHDPIAATAAVTTEVLCNGSATGEIEVTATGGTTPLQYAISPGYVYGTTNLFTGLVAGTYDVKVKDAITCEVTTASVTVTEPAAALAATLAHTDETCFDSNNGSITITIAGGTAPYETSLNGGAFSTATFYTALADGTYTIDVRDGNGCSIAQLTQVIQNGVDMQPSAAVTPNCVANTPNNDVVITIATGITLSDVTYSIDGTNYQASNTFTNVSLSPNTYTAYAKHANGCIQTTPFTIDIHDPIAATAAVTANVLCKGDATGEIEVTATGGTTPLQYAISPGYVYGTTNVFTGLVAGTYDVKVKDAITCEVTTTSVTITEPAAALTATLAHTDETCFDSNNGSITITIAGGTAPYETSLNGAAFSTSTSYTALADGTYTIDVRDDNGCSIAQLTQVIQNGVDMQPSAGVTPNCVANTPNNDVVITIASGITATDVTYSIDGTNYQTSNTFTNVGLTPGTYTAYAKHANGCIQTDAFTIDVHTPLMHTGTLTLNITCYGNNTGEATLSVIGGTGTLQYAMAPGYVYQTANIFTGLAPGTYDFKVKDAIGCEIDIPNVPITEPFGPLAATLDHTNETCFNSNDGTLTVNITGGTPPYSTSLDGAVYVQGQTVYTNLADGTHTINVTDAFACTIPQQSVVIVNGVNMQPVATITPNCVNNAADNNVVITIASGITQSDVTYSIDGTNYQSSNTFANVGLTAGTYTAYAKHANSCIQQTAFTIAPHAPVIANVTTVVPVLCYTNATGSITVTATGGTTPLEYAIANENTTPLVYSNYQTSSTLTGLVAGTYTISVKDAIGCEVVLAGNVVDGPVAALIASVTPTHESCVNDDDGKIDITVTGGTAPYSTSLNGATYVAGQLSYNNLDGGNYTVDVMDANGCHIGAPIAVTINEGVQLQATLNVTQVCEDVQVVVSVNPTATGTLVYTLDGLYTQSSNTFNSAVTPMAVGQHTIAVTHSAGCTEELIFNVAPRAAIIIDYAVTKVACKDTDTGVIVVNATGGTGALQYAITYDILPIATYSSDNTFDELLGGKEYTILVKDAMGCVESVKYYMDQPAERLLIASTVVRHERCILDRNGGIDINITGGVAPYLTALNSPTPNNFQPITSYNNLFGGTYDVYVMDAVGCYTKTTVVVESGVNLDPYIQTVTSCENNLPVNKVTVKLHLTVADVTYSLNPAGPFTANNVFEVASGQHTVYIRHKNGCEKSLPFTIQDRLPVTAQVAPVAAKCNGEASGTITVTATGGTGAFKYAIADGSATPVVFGNFQTSKVFTGLSASNTYIIRVEDAYGCFTEVRGVVVGQPDAIVLTTPIIIQEEVCINDGDAAIELENPTGGTAPYATSLNAAGPFVTDQYLFDNLDGGKTYTVYVQDANGCIATASVTLAAPMDINATAKVEYDCEENKVTIVTNSNISSSDLTYIISGPKGNYPPQTGNVYTNIEDGTYSVEVINTVTGCSAITAPFTIESAQALALAITKTGLNQITANAVGGVGMYRYTFDNNDNGTKNTYIYSGSGRIKVTVTDSRGCSTDAFIDVVFIDVIIPDVMTPDGDGQNDVWSPGNTQNYPNINTDIFDRYGRKLATLRQGQTWDGKYDGNYMPTGDYWYLIKLGDAEDRDFVGHFTIYR